MLIKLIFKSIENLKIFNGIIKKKVQIEMENTLKYRI